MANEWVKYSPLQLRYNSTENCEIKDFLPIIGNEIPNKLHNNFSTLDNLTVAGTGATMALDYRVSPKEVACVKVATATSGAPVTLTYTPTLPIDMINLSTTTNNFATIKRTGKYGNEEDKLYLALKVKVTNYLTIKFKFFNGTKTATVNNASYWEANGATQLNKWHKNNLPLDSTAFDYAAGFTATDWESITKIEIEFYSAFAALQNVYIAGLWSALPLYKGLLERGSARTNSYYPAITEATAIYVSWLFGSDANNGQTRDVPVKTIEKAMTLITGTRIYVVITDSEKYFPTTASKPGITNTLSTVKPYLIADYLETPTISASYGLINKNRVGARLNYRTTFNTPTIYVSKSGADANAGTAALPKLTIGAAITAASGGGCIEIMDSGVYDEILTIDKALTIQAAPQMLPVLKATSANTFAISCSASYTPYKFYGLIFEGNAYHNIVGYTNWVLVQNSAEFKDCTFKNIGPSISSSAVNIILVSAGASVSVENCLYTKCGKTGVGVSGTVTGGEQYIITNSIAASSYFVFVKLDTTATMSSNPAIFIMNNRMTGDLRTTATFFSLVSTSGTTASKGINVNISFNLLEDAVIAVSAQRLALCNIYISYNYFDKTFYSAANQTESILIGVDNVSEGTNNYLYIESNIFYFRDNASNTKGIVYNNGSRATHFIRNNFFYSTLVAGSPMTGIEFLYATTANQRVIESNVFINFSGWGMAGTVGANAQTVNKNIFCDCTVAILITGSGTLNNTNSIRYNSPNNGTTFSEAGLSLLSPGFIDAPTFNLAWYEDSILETSTNGYRDFQSSFISPAGTYGMGFYFLNCEGSKLGSFYSPNTATSWLDVKYNKISGCLAGIRVKSTSSASTFYNSLVQNNGFGIRVDNAVLETSVEFDRNIVQNNNIGVMVRSATFLEFDTIINNDRGVTGYFTGFFAFEEYQSQAIILRNTIIYFSYDIDLNLMVNTDYCIIGHRIGEKGTHDSSAVPVLLPGSLFPATIYAGYLENSTAYLTSEVAGKNIGARVDNNITAAPSYSSFTLADLSSPYKINETLEPINLSEVFDVSGNYSANNDAVISKLLLTWGEPGTFGKLSDIEKTVLTNFYKTYWFVGISRDAGVTWEYYMVEKGNKPGYSRQRYLYSEMPWGSNSLSLLPMPSDFTIAKYTL